MLQIMLATAAINVFLLVAVLAALLAIYNIRDRLDTIVTLLEKKKE